MSQSKLNVLIVGATGRIGKEIVSAFLKHQRFQTTLLVRPSAQEDEIKRSSLDAFVSSGVQIVSGSMEEAVETLAPKLHGIDIIVVSARGNGVAEAQINLVKAAAQAGVRRFVPSEYIFDLTPYTADWNPAWNGIMSVRAAIEATNKLEYTYVAVSGFLEYTFSPFLGFDLQGGKVSVPGDGSFLMSGITVPDFARLLPEVLLHPESRNAVVQLASGSFRWINEIATLEKSLGKKFDLTFRGLEELKKAQGEQFAVLVQDWTNFNNFMAWYMTAVLVCLLEARENPSRDFVVSISDEDKKCTDFVQSHSFRYWTLYLSLLLLFVL